MPFHSRRLQSKEVDRRIDVMESRRATSESPWLGEEVSETWKWTGSAYAADDVIKASDISGVT